MLSTIITWVYIFLLALMYGTALLQLMPLRDELQDPSNRSVSIIALLGLAVLASIAGVLSLVINLGLAANLIILLVAVGLGFWQRKFLQQFLLEKIRALRQGNKLVLLAFLAIFLVILLKSTQPVQNYDTGLYHAQAIRWMETYRAIPGLGNLHDRLVFNSSWLLAQGLFSFSFTGLRSFHTLNALLAVILCGFALGKFDRLSRGEVTLANASAVFLPFLLRRIFSLELSSPGTDLPAALVIWIVLTLSIEKVDEKSTARFDFLFLAIFVLSIFAVTIKLSTLPILLLLLYFFLRQSGGVQRSSLATGALLAALIFLPWMSRGLVQSGYLVYPVPQTDIFHPDWRIPEENARGTMQWIQNWAKVATPDREAVEQMGVGTWAPIWFHNLEPLDRQILILNVTAFVLLIFLFAALAWYEGPHRAFLSPYSIIYVAVVSGLLYWFFQAPAVRFGYAFLAFFPVVCLAPIVLYAMRRFALVRLWAVPMMLIALLLYQGISVYRLANLETLRGVLVFPVDYPRVETQAHSLGSMVVYTPMEGNQCWYEPFPCVPSIDSDLRLRGSAIVDGFRMNP